MLKEIISNIIPIEKIKYLLKTEMFLLDFNFINIIILYALLIFILTKIYIKNKKNELDIHNFLKNKSNRTDLIIITLLILIKLILSYKINPNFNDFVNTQYSQILTYKHQAILIKNITLKDLFSFKFFDISKDLALTHYSHPIGFGIIIGIIYKIFNYTKPPITIILTHIIFSSILIILYYKIKGNNNSNKSRISALFILILLYLNPLILLNTSITNESIIGFLVIIIGLIHFKKIKTKQIKQELDKKIFSKYKNKHMKTYFSDISNYFTLLIIISGILVNIKLELGTISVFIFLIALYKIIKINLLYFDKSIQNITLKNNLRILIKKLNLKFMFFSFLAFLLNLHIINILIINPSSKDFSIKYIITELAKKSGNILIENKIFLFLILIIFLSIFYTTINIKKNYLLISVLFLTMFFIMFKDFYRIEPRYIFEIVFLFYIAFIFSNSSNKKNSLIKPSVITITFILIFILSIILISDNTQKYLDNLDYVKIEKIENVSDVYLCGYPYLKFYLETENIKTKKTLFRQDLNISYKDLIEVSNEYQDKTIIIYDDCLEQYNTYNIKIFDEIKCNKTQKSYYDKLINRKLEYIIYTC
jgi:hypothetical protein